MNRFPWRCRLVQSRRFFLNRIHRRWLINSHTFNNVPPYGNSVLSGGRIGRADYVSIKARRGFSGRDFSSEDRS